MSEIEGSMSDGLATANYVATHGPLAISAGSVHGFSVAFAVGAGFLVLGAVASALFVTARAGDAPTLDAPSSLTNMSALDFAQSIPSADLVSRTGEQP